MKFHTALAACSLLGLSSIHAAEAKPNVLFVFIDDMGWSDFSCFGNTTGSTPNIDSLAAEGIRFHQFYVNAPICSPSRCAITTGQYPQRWRIDSFLASRSENANRGIANWLDPAAPTLPRMLHNAGYATGHFGKWHLGGQRNVGDAPLITEYGFDQSLTSFEGLGPRVLALVDPYDGSAVTRYTLGSDKLGRGPIYWEDRSKITSRWTNAAVDFIQKAKSEGKPFYVNLWPDDVHSPFYPPRERRKSNAKRALYDAVLEALDEQLGPVFDLIRNDPELRDNTIILICSDNGPESGAGISAPYRGLKGQLYEGGIRSPLIVWAPGFMNPSKTGTINTTSYFAAIDVVASILTAAGAAPPDGVTLDGVPVLDTLLGNSTASRSGALFFRRPPDRKTVNGVGGQPDLAMRDGRWKLLCDYDGSAAQLYDLETDAREQTNLAASQPARVQQMKAALLAWNATMPRAIDAPDPASVLPAMPAMEVPAIPEAEAAAPSPAVFADHVTMLRSKSASRLRGRVQDADGIQRLHVRVNGKRTRLHLRSSETGERTAWRATINGAVRRVQVGIVDGRGIRESMSYSFEERPRLGGRRSHWRADALAD